MDASERNDPCPCGSGKKYKKCCLFLDEVSKNEKVSFLLHEERAEEIIRSSGAFPVDRCLINKGWKGKGLANIVVIRRQQDGCFVLGVYLADLFCLGIKNAFCNAGISMRNLDKTLAGCSGGEVLESIDLNYAKEIVFGSIEYARKLGFEPHRDFKLAREVLGAGEIIQKHDIRFGGPDGEPLFISGPDDDADAILRKLSERN